VWGHVFGVIDVVQVDDGRHGGRCAARLCWVQDEIIRVLYEFAVKHLYPSPSPSEAERMAIVAELAGAAAHELNQPLTSVMGYAQMLLRKLGPNEPLVPNVQTILDEAERMATIVRKLGSLTRYETKNYVGGAQILDIDRSAPEGDPRNK